MSEAKQQAKRIGQLERAGWYVIKLIKTNKNGIPDLLALKKGQPPFFIEVKAKDGKLSPLQHYRIEELQQLGFTTTIDYEKE